MRLEGALLLVTLRDDGVGFDPAGTYDGHGLASLSDRMRSLGGRLEITSQPGRGTTVLLAVPLG